MCVILAIEPNVEFDFNKLKSACTVNPHGWGLALPDRGKMEILKGFDPKGNDPDQINRLLEENKSLKRFLHLRYNTAGKSNEDNCHPFEILTDKEDGYSICVMHNGTYSEYSRYGEGMSDTYHITQRLFKPAFKLALGATEGDYSEVLYNPQLASILENTVGRTISSKLVFIDQDAQSLIINKSEGHSGEGWWSSNTYSFNTSHREPSYKSYSTYSSTGGGQTTGNFTKGKMTQHTQNSGKTSSNEKTKNSTEEVNRTTSDTTTKNLPIPFRLNKEANQSLSFCDVFDLNTLDEVTVLSEENIEELVLEHPVYATLLIRDLLFELYKKNVKPKGQKVAA